MYIFTFILLGFLAFSDVFLKHGKYFLLLVVLAAVWLIFHDGFRWGVGTDWEAYYNYFNTCLTNNNVDDFEPGYVLLSQAVRWVTDNYAFFLILHAILVYVLITISILKHSANPLLSLFLFYCVMLTYLGSNREYIAFAICVYSYRFIFEKKILPFLCCIVVAFFFHRSSVLFVFAYFLNRDFSIKYIIWILLSSIAISLSGIMNKLPLNLFFLTNSTIGDKLNFYTDEYVLKTNFLVSMLALLKRSIWIILAIAYRKSIKNMDEHFNFFFNMYYVGTIIYIIFNNTVLQIVVARGVLYFNIAEIFLIPYILTIFRKGITKNIMFAAISIYGFLLIEKGISFYKENLGVDIYNPYNSVLIDDTYDAMQK